MTVIFAESGFLTDVAAVLTAMTGLITGILAFWKYLDERRKRLDAEKRELAAEERNVDLEGENAVLKAEYATPLSGNNPEMTFEEVIKAILASHPGATLGRTVEQGQYYERAKSMTNYLMYEADPPWYGAAQPNGKTMWLYLGKGGKICCGDKE